MKPTIHILFPGIVLAALLPFIGGCYTQLATVESAYDENQAVEDTAIADAEEYEEYEEFDRDYPPPDYYLTFSYYHPGFGIMYSPYDPWAYWYYGPTWYSPWYPPYYPAYTCWPYYQSCYPYYPVVYNGSGNHGGYYPGGGGGSQTRDFGNSRGLGDPTGTRARGGIVGRTGGGDDGNQGTVVPASISRPGRQGGATIAGNTGKQGGPPQRKAAVNRPPTRKVQSESAPTNRGSSGSSRGGSDRGSVSSPPRSSPPSAPSSSGNRGSSGSGSRSGSPRSR